jgi:hypothetical protein
MTWRWRFGADDARRCAWARNDQKHNPENRLRF